MGSPAANSEATGRHGTGRRLHGAIARKLGADILSGDYEAGATLPTEAVATITLGVSRAAYREAVQVLIAKGTRGKPPESGHTGPSAGALEPAGSRRARLGVCQGPGPASDRKPL